MNQPLRAEVRTTAGPISFTIERSARRRSTVGITVDPGRGVVVRAPLRLPRQAIDEVVARRAGWIRARLTAVDTTPPAPDRFTDGTRLLLEGRDVTIRVYQVTAHRGSITIADDTLRVGLPAAFASHWDDATHSAVARWLHRHAQAVLLPRVAAWAAFAGVSPASVRIVEQRRRWGSCSATGSIRLNWRLVMLPPDLADSVIVHELTHLRVLNHSATFWAAFERLMPDARARRVRLNGLAPRVLPP